jgi:flagellar biosynthesis anti-sigma factor FlgM
MNISFVATTDSAITDPTLAQSSTQSSGANRTPGSQKTSSGDAAIVSLGSSIDELTTQLESMPDMRGDRVQQLRTMVEQGTYTVNPVNVANAMFATQFGES